MERVSKSYLPEFLAGRAYSVVHIDAEWDGHRNAASAKMHDAETGLQEKVSFGYMDCDAEQDYANDISIVNVPSVAYYSGTKLFGVVIGVQQDVTRNIERMMRGENFG